MKDELLNGSAGYGSLTNIIKMERVYAVTHYEGIGTDKSPMREIKTFFDEKGNMIARVDPVK